jgi:2-keto-3-deoxy-L-rhamnonate aldolase RhmA
MASPPDSPGRWHNPQFEASSAATCAAELLVRGHQLRRRLEAGQALGTFLIELPAPNAVRALALAGFDFVVIDLEHSAIDFASLDALLAASNAAGLVTLVRPWNVEAGLIGKILDCGAHGIMAPHVDTADRARDVVAQARFAPRGQRGFAPLSRFDPLDAPLQALCEATIVVVQIEGREGLSRVRDIAAVEGVDAVFIGPYDLALSLNLAPGSPAVFESAAAIARSVASHVHLGIYIDDSSQCGEWVARRFALQCVSFDGRMFADAAKAIVKSARTAARG